jgi:hypothetical protein
MPGLLPLSIPPTTRRTPAPQSTVQMGPACVGAGSRVVATVNDPMPADHFFAFSAHLEATYGPGVRVRRGRWSRFEFRTPGPVCSCEGCVREDAMTVEALTAATHARR